MEEGIKKNLEDLQITLTKQFGKGTIFQGSKTKNNIKIEKWEMESPELASIFGEGFPKGRIIEIYGPESSGKTTLATIIAGNIQKQNENILYIDTEHVFDIEYAKKLGLDTDEDSFLISQPNNGEQALEIVEQAIKSNSIGLIVVDSVAALTPKAEIEGNMGDAHMGLQARLMSQAMRKIIMCLAKSKTSIIFLNQLRNKIGVIWGSNETTTGGNALKFYASIRIDIRRIEWLKQGDKVYGQKVRIKSVKNKITMPFKKIELDLEFGLGFNIYKEYIELGVTYNIIDKMGTWYSYKDTRLGQGKDNASKYLKTNIDIFNNVKKDLKAVMYPGKETPKEEMIKVKRKVKKEK